MNDELVKKISFDVLTLELELRDVVLCYIRERFLII